jgi:hypothetical protein
VFLIFLFELYSNMVHTAYSMFWRWESPMQEVKLSET